MNPLVSVIVPAYNHEKYVYECLQSVADQTYDNIELIVLNDGSSDNTEQVINQFIIDHQKMNIHFVSKNNEGVCKTLNQGLNLANGAYVVFLASDDVWMREKIDKQVHFMKSNTNVGMVFTDAFFMNFDKISKIKWSDYKHNLRKYFVNGIQNVNMFNLLLTYPIIPALTVMIRREVFETVGGFDNELIYEDDDMWIRIAKKYPLAYIDEPLAYYRLHNTNISNDFAFMIKGMFQTIKKHLNSEPFKGKPIAKASIVCRLCFNLVIGKIKKLFSIKQTDSL